MSNTWICVLCSVKNERSLIVCSFCQAAPNETLNEIRPPTPNKKRKHEEPAPPSRSSSNTLFEWACKICTLNNSFAKGSCGGCGRPRFPGNDEPTEDIRIIEHLSSHPPEAKRPKLAEIENNNWACRFCTFINDLSYKVCQCCETPKESSNPKLENGGLRRTNSILNTPEMAIILDEEGSEAINTVHVEDLMAEEASQDSTTTQAFIDTLTGSCAQCPICGCEFEIEDIDSLTEHASLHVSGDSSKFQVSVVSSSDASSSVDQSTRNNSSRKKGGYEVQLDTRRFTTAYEHQYARSYLRSFSAAKTIAEIQDHLNEVTRSMLITPDSVTADSHLISALHEHYRLFPSASRKVALATHVKHFSSGHGDRGWGCGYRNIQMLASSLLEIPHFKSLLFGGIGHIPTIPVLQQCLEAAWSIGFDPGSSMRKEGVFGGNRWIGTYDAVSLLRNFGVHVEMQTFGAKLRPGAKENGTSSKSSSSGGPVSVLSFLYRRYQTAIYVPHKALFDWVWKYFETRKQRGDRVIPPLYLQHDGHSRTIVGAENVNGRIALLIFDPSFPPKDASYRLRNEASIPDVLRKTLSEFRHQNYQVAYVADTSRPISEQNRKHFKTIVQPPIIFSDN